MEWINVKDTLPKFHGIIDVRRSDGTSTKAYYHADKFGWAHCYENFPWSHFQEKSTLKWLDDVTHWRQINEK